MQIYVPCVTHLIVGADRSNHHSIHPSVPFQSFGHFQHASSACKALFAAGLSCAAVLDLRLKSLEGLLLAFFLLSLGSSIKKHQR